MGWKIIKKMNGDPYKTYYVENASNLRSSNLT